MSGDSSTHASADTTWPCCSGTAGARPAAISAIDAADVSSAGAGCDVEAATGVEGGRGGGGELPTPNVAPPRGDAAARPGSRSLPHAPHALGHSWMARWCVHHPCFAASAHDSTSKPTDCASWATFCGSSSTQALPAPWPAADGARAGACLLSSTPSSFPCAVAGNVDTCGLKYRAAVKLPAVSKSS